MKDGSRAFLSSRQLEKGRDREGVSCPQATWKGVEELLWWVPTKIWWARVQRTQSSWGKGQFLIAVSFPITELCPKGVLKISITLKLQVAQKAPGCVPTEPLSGPT